MNTCPTCQNDLVCQTHRAMSDTPETDVYATHKNDVYEFVDPEWDWVVSADFARNLERQLAEARQAFAVATGQLVQVQGELRRVREENARLREVVKEAHDAIERLLDKGHDDRCAWINYANAACTCGDWAGHIVLRNLKPFVAP